MVCISLPIAIIKELQEFSSIWKLVSGIFAPYYLLTTRKYIQKWKKTQEHAPTNGEITLGLCSE